MSNVVVVLRSYGFSDEDLINIQTDVSKLKKDDKTVSALMIAQQMTVEPGTSSEYLKKAKEKGWTDEQLAEIIYITAEYNMINRIVSAFECPPDKMHQFDPDGEWPVLNNIRPKKRIELKDK